MRRYGLVVTLGPGERIAPLTDPAVLVTVARFLL